MEPDVYLSKMEEALGRLDMCERYLASHKTGNTHFELESAALQLRKAMEAIAFAAIAPNKEAYAAIRRNAEKSADFRNDWSADSIFLNLERINPDFYPVPLLEPVQTKPGHWFYDKPTDGFIARKAFETLYKRLGKFLHADNPWGHNKGWEHFAADLPGAIQKIRALLKKHHTLLQAPGFSGAWIVDAPSDGTPPRMIRAEAQGEFITVNSRKRK